MQRPKNTRLILIAASFLFLFGGMTEIVFADVDHTESAGWALQSGTISNSCADGQGDDSSPCGDIHYCVNCSEVLVYISPSIDSKSDKLTAYQRIRRTQVDNQPHFRPPRIS